MTQVSHFSETHFVCAANVKTLNLDFLRRDLNDSTEVRSFYGLTTYYNANDGLAYIFQVHRINCR